MSDVNPCAVFGQRPVVSNRYAIVASLTLALQTSIDSQSVIFVGSELADCLMRRMKRVTDKRDTQRSTQPVTQISYMLTHN